MINHCSRKKKKNDSEQRNFDNNIIKYNIHLKYRRIRKYYIPTIDCIIYNFQNFKPKIENVVKY